MPKLRNKWKCPVCKGSWRDRKIPKEDRYLFGNKTYFSKIINIYDYLRDKTVAFMCPFCYTKWDRVTRCQLISKEGD